MANIEINVAENGTTTLATAGKYCDRNIDVVVEVAGAGGGDIPEEAFLFSGNCSGVFSNDKWKWFYDAYNDKITFTDITNISSLFEKSSYTEINGEATLASSGTQDGMSYIFSNMTNLKTLNFKVNGPFKSTNMSWIFQNCYNLREVPNIFENMDMSYFDNNSYGQQEGMFYHCYSLREVDESFWDNFVISRTNNYGHLYREMYYQCSSIDKATIPINTAKTLTSNCFSSTCFQNMYRVKDILFLLDADGNPQIANWTNQTIDLDSNKYIGYAYTSSTNMGYILNYNSGITVDKRVTDAATYEALKNDADWWTTDGAYSRYNHDSAVNTINSLPDTSAYLASAGGTNTIKFKGTSGSLTDGGAINTLTEEEIAVAAAKGWTVSLV